MGVDPISTAVMAGIQAVGSAATTGAAQEAVKGVAQGATKAVAQGAVNPAQKGILGAVGDYSKGVISGASELNPVKNAFFNNPENIQKTDKPKAPEVSKSYEAGRNTVKKLKSSGDIPVAQADQASPSYNPGQGAGRQQQQQAVKPVEFKSFEQYLNESFGA